MHAMKIVWGISTEEYLSKEDYLPEENIYLKEDYLSKEEYLLKEETILCMHQDLTNQQMSWRIQLENTVGEYSWRIQRLFWLEADNKLKLENQTKLLSSTETATILSPMSLCFQNIVLTEPRSNFNK